MKLEFSRQIFVAYSDMKFHEHPSCGSRVVRCGRTDMTKQIVPCRSFAKASKNKLWKRVHIREIAVRCLDSVKSANTNF